MASVLRTPGLSRLRALGPVTPRVQAPVPPVPVPAELTHRLAESFQQQPLLMEASRRLTENFGTFSSWGWPSLWQAYQNTTFPGPGGFPYRGASGTTIDRQYGRDLPFFWSEVDLRGYRVTSRYLAETNPFAIGFVNLLKGYHVRKGYGWQVFRAGQKVTPYAVSDGDPLVEKGQRILDQFRSDNKWSVFSREAFDRWRVDGEVFAQVNWHWAVKNGERRPEIWVRWIEPEQVGAPDGATSTPWSFGIDVLEYEDGKIDPQTVLAYHVWDLESGMTRGEWLDAKFVVHAKANVVSNVKRGRGDFFPVMDLFDGVRRLYTNMLLGSVDMAAIAWREKFPNRGVANVGGAIPQNQLPNGQTVPSDQSCGQWGTGQGYGPWWLANGAGNKFRPSTVVRVEGDREFEPGPTADGAANFELVVKLAMRAARMRWNLPGSASGDAEDTTFAAAIQAGGPFPVAVEGSQTEWGECFEREVAMKALDRAVDAGLLTREERRQLDVKVEEPAVVTPEPEKDTQRHATEHSAGVLSATTWQLKSGLDPKTEAANFAAEAKRNAANGPAGGPNPNDPGPPGPGGPDDGKTKGIFGAKTESKDAAGHQHKGTGAGGGQFTSGDSGAATPKTNPKAAPAGATKAPRTQPDPPPERFAKSASGRNLIDANVQRWAEGTNEPEVAKHVGGKALPDNEPMDVVLPPPPDAPAHGLELKTMVSNSARKIVMKGEAQDRKRAWRRKNKVPVHTVVIDDTAVYNANGPGQHDLSKRRVFYRRGFGSFKVDGMYEVPGGIAGLKALLDVPTRKLPPGAWKPKAKATESEGGGRDGAGTFPVAEHQANPPHPGEVFNDQSHRWERPNSGNPAAPQANTQVTPAAPANPSEPSADARKAAEQMVNMSKEPLSQDQRDAYADHLAHVLHRMPRASLTAAIQALKGAKVAFHESIAEVKIASEAITKTKEKGQIAGFVAYRKGSYDKVELHLDGAGAGNTAQGVYAHELGHLVGVRAGQETGERPEDDPKWVAAWKAEIYNPPANKKSLGAYARTSAKEGWAELYRHLHEHGVDETRARFPRATKFLESKGLLK